MGCGCSKKRVRKSPTIFAAAKSTANVGGDWVEVRCTNCKVMLKGSNNVIYPAHTGQWFRARKTDVDYWRAMGFEFETK